MIKTIESCKRRAQLVAVALLLKRRKDKRIYIRELFQKRSENGEHFLLPDLENDPSYHHTYFRMQKSSFETIYELIKHRINHKPTHAFPISPKIRLAITLRYLATGMTQTQMAMGYRVSPSSVSCILRETMIAIVDSLGPIYLPTPTHDTWKKSEQMFRDKWNFPFCVGAIDGKHVRIRCPSNSGSLNFNYKGYFSKSVLAVVSADYRFIVVDIGAPGSESDGAIFRNTSFLKAVESKTLQLPENGKLGEAQSEVPHLFVADQAFPLKPWLMRPYPGRELDLKQKVFNYRLSRARRVVENAFGIWAARWRILFTPIEGDADLVHLIINSTIILHNFLRSVVDDEVEAHERDNSWPGSQAGGLIEIPRVGSNNYILEAFEMREIFANYFLSDEGRRQGQEIYVMRT